MRWFAPLLVLFALTALASCTTVHTWNQKLTVVVATPEGQVSGSSIVTVTKRHSDGPLVLPEAQGVRSRVAGDAAVVELPNGAYLFVLLKGQDDLALFAFEDAVPHERGGDYDRWIRRIARHRAPGIVPPAHYPMMVTFDDISDPKTVREVDPNALSETFREGYALVEMRLEITEETSDERLHLFLGFLNGPSERSITNNTDPFDFSVGATLKIGDFVKR